MKTFRLITMLFALFIILNSCSRNIYHGVGHIPPGHAKKMAGKKSAKSFAPGHLKKKKH